jgi:hypothetical protein
LPFADYSPLQVQELTSPATGVLSLTTAEYAGPDRQPWLLVTQFHHTGSVSFPNPISAGQVGQAPATFYKYTVTWRTGSATVLGVGWTGSNGKEITIDSEGLTQAELVRVAESIS